MRTTIRAFGTDCAVTNTTISYADGRTKETLLNGVVKTAYEYDDSGTKCHSLGLIMCYVDDGCF